MYRKINIVAKIKVRRPEGVGQVVGMSDCRIVKKAFLGKSDGRRKAGKPKLRYLYCTANDLKEMGVKRWRKKAEDRSVRAILLKETKVKL
jgi:hypothetical protein